jgi:iron complex transport system permease protein
MLMKPPRIRRVSGPLAAIIVLVCFGIAAASLLVGTETLSLGRAWRDWQSGMAWNDSPTLSVLVNQRLPRTLAAFMAGGALALVGCAFQALLRNPLATPYTLGVASAGALGAWAATVLLQGTALWFTIFHFTPVHLGAFLFALLDVLIIYAIAARHSRMAPSVLLLTGVTLGMLANALIMFLRFLASPEKLVIMDRFLMGGVDVVGYDFVQSLFIGLTPCAVILLAQAVKLDQLGFGTELAASRGVQVKRLQAVVFLVGSLATALVAASVGPIGFVGLIVPHSVRALTGSRHRLLMPLSLAAGGAFLCLCDIVARKILPGETPIGIITALCGGPFFLYLLVRRGGREWES